MPNVTSNIREEYLFNGYVVLKSVFKKKDIRNLRDHMIELSKKDNNTNEILLSENVQKLLLNKELIKNIKKMLNSESLLYYSDSSCVNNKDPFKVRSWYHNDARGEDQNIPFEEEYPIVRLGLYFENVKDFSGGLKIKKKSHKYFLFTFVSIKRIISDALILLKSIFLKSRYDLGSFRLGKGINLALEEGDIAIWNLRTHHCGMSRRLKIFPNLCLQPFIEQLLPRFFFLPTQYQENRCAIFCTFAKDDLNNKNIKGYVEEKLILHRINSIKENPKLAKKLEEVGCKLPPVPKKV